MHPSTADAMGSADAGEPRRRIDGLDVARAVAILGMVGSHTGDEGIRGADSDGWGWLAVTHGHPSALFAVLAGVSMTLMVTRRGTLPVTALPRDDLSGARVRIAVRAAILIILGFFMSALGTPVAVILGNLGLMFLLALPMLRWRSGVLLAGAGAFAVGGRWLARIASEWAGDSGMELVPVVGALWSEHYPALAWMAYIMVGLALGRMDLRATGTAVGLLVGGGATAAAAWTVGWALRMELSGASDSTIENWLTDEDHSYTPVEMVLNIGVACAVIGLALLLAARWPRALWPLASAGSMALTLYVAHLIVIAIVGAEMVWEPSNVSFVALALGLVAFACVWRAAVGQGPLERVLTSTSTALAAPRP
ncbi:heparan-alpha-glucosaminide N-acetyltransferase domain-containing protein [Demequina sp. SO4-13]|uniref:heparan-alpha-glucosaminide N-acetyltransferase domain-containing protein n=1 Tax=Demequina sp. SO4-13 TaxID=3401027 RepID=UPI003AF78DC9